MDAPLSSPQVLAQAQPVKMLILDVDGVLTDGGIYVTESGAEIKAFNVTDGLGLKMLQATGVTLAVITGRTCQAVAHRIKELGFEHYYAGVRDKFSIFSELLAKTGLEAHECAYMGDDIVDVAVMRACALPIAVADAHWLVRENARYITRRSGGHGAVREACELIMHAQGSLEGQLQQHISHT